MILLFKYSQDILNRYISSDLQIQHTFASYFFLSLHRSYEILHKGSLRETYTESPKAKKSPTSRRQILLSKLVNKRCGFNLRLCLSNQPFGVFNCFFPKTHENMSWDPQKDPLGRHPAYSTRIFVQAVEFNLKKTLMPQEKFMSGTVVHSSTFK